MILRVADGRMKADGRTFPCALGHAGTIAVACKREGDGRTPIGLWPIRAALIRRDRGLAPPQTLPWRWIRREDGWSDDPADPAYNRPVRLPHRFSAERLWRDDHAYDAVLVLGHNLDPPRPGWGSAIFFHLTPDRGATEGCVAIDRAAMAWLLPRLRPEDAVEVLGPRAEQG